MIPRPPKKSLLQGVCTSRQPEKFKSTIVHQKVRHYLGTFNSEQEAHDAYMRKKKEFGAKLYSTGPKPKPQRKPSARSINQEIKNALSGTPWMGLL